MTDPDTTSSQAVAASQSLDGCPRPRPKATMCLLVIAFSMSLLYGSSYQLFRHFDLAASGMLTDSMHYIQMSKGDLNVPNYWRYRVAVPFMAGAIQPVLDPANKWGLGQFIYWGGSDVQRAKLSFYIVNYVFVVAAAYLLFLILLQLGFHPITSLVGLAIFLGSRVVSMCVGAPLVDSVYMFAMALIVYLILTKRLVLLAIVGPLLVVLKEPVLPLLLLPLVQKPRRWWTVGSFVAGMAVFFAYRGAIDHFFPAVQPTAARGLVAALYEYWGPGVLPQFLVGALSPMGIYDSFNGYALFIVMAIIGMVMNRIQHRRRIPLFMILLIPFGILLAWLSGNLDRMIFSTTFVVLIPYVLLVIEAVMCPKPLTSLGGVQP